MRNPFFGLYVGDRISSSEYVTIFSEYLVPHVEPMFMQGNVVVTGAQGSGKSMLLSLLKPNVRLEYEKAGKNFPVHKDHRKFLSANVNLAHSNAIDFGLRKDIDKDPQEIEFLFGDFVNFLALQSLINCINTFSNSSPKIRSEVGLLAGNNSSNLIAEAISCLPVWDGAIDECGTMLELEKQFQDRIIGYRRYLHRKVKKLDKRISSTRTQLGVPLIECVQALHSNNFIEDDTNVFVDIDQYEELGNISSRDTPGQSVDYRSVVNRALATRDPRISYRIGTRGHAWKKHSKIMGTDAKLEEERDYKYVDLDVLLKRRENSKVWIFPNFAKDVFDRRMAFSRYDVGANATDLIRKVYGKDPNPLEKTKLLTLRKPEKVLKLDPKWTKKNRERLLALAKKDLHSAKLGEIWLRQKGEIDNLDVPDSELPWEKKKYWKKERKEVVLFKIASAGRQQPIWCGADEIINLSGGNILVFLSLNQFIWDTYEMYKGTRDNAALPSIDEQIQTIGVRKASKFWVEKIKMETGRSSERSSFIEKLAEFLRKRLFGDEALSNPGHTGISIRVEDLLDYPDIQGFLQEMDDYGNMVMLDHTTKSSDKKNRKKMYFNPIFCPHLGLPYIQTKEPYYARIAEVSAWIQRSGHNVSFSTETSTQLDLPI